MRSVARCAVFALLFVVAMVAAAESYRGNTQSRVFHQSSCRYYTCKNCTATFASASEAVNRGYRPCGVCRPAQTDSPAASTAEESYSGNTSTHKFHRSSCRYASCKHCTAKFRSRQEAIDAGYAPGGCCNP